MEKNKKKKQKWVKKRHSFIFRLLMILVIPIIKLIIPGKPNSTQRTIIFK